MGQNTTKTKLKSFNKSNFLYHMIQIEKIQFCFYLTLHHVSRHNQCVLTKFTTFLFVMQIKRNDSLVITLLWRSMALNATLMWHERACSLLHTPSIVFLESFLVKKLVHANRKSLLIFVPSLCIFFRIKHQGIHNPFLFLRRHFRQSFPLY